jgi:hypothetical protein
MKTKQIPNCAICKWNRCTGFLQSIVGVSCCLAQGGINATNVYNNKLCKKLFEEKKQEIIITQNIKEAEEN